MYIEREFNRNIGLVLTLRCPIQCSHCFLDAGPLRNEEINLRDAHNWIDELASYRNGFIKGLSLTGGEPFYILEKLQDVVNYAASLNIMTTVTTSAFWATNKRRALMTLESLPLAMIAISTDSFHQHFVPLSYIENAVHAAERCDIPYEIIIATKDINSSECQKDIENVTKITDYKNIEVTKIFQVGRAKNIDTKKIFVKKPPRIPCLFATSPFIFPDGKVIACIGPLATLNHEHPLILGNLNQNSLEHILDKSEENLVLQTLRLWGPSKLFETLLEQGKDEYVPKSFVDKSICENCYKLFENPVIMKEIGNLNELREEIAYARMLQLGENKMIEKIIGKKIKVNFNVLAHKGSVSGLRLYQTGTKRL